jgi:hypothetical protein
VNDEATELEVVQKPLNKNENEKPEKVRAECEKAEKENSMDEANTNNEGPANDKEGQKKDYPVSSLPPSESGPLEMPQSPACLESEQSKYDLDSILIDGEMSGHDLDIDKGETETMYHNHVESVDDQIFNEERVQEHKFDFSGVSPPGCFPIRRDDTSFLLLPQPSPCSEQSSDIEETFEDVRYAVSASTSEENDEGGGPRENIGEIPTIMSPASTSVTSTDEGQDRTGASKCNFEVQNEDFDLDKLNYVVRIDEKTILESIREQSEGLSIDTETDVHTCENCQPLINDLRWQLNCLMVEKKKLEDHVHSYRKGYEGQVTPFRNVFVDVSYCSDGE